MLTHTSIFAPQAALLSRDYGMPLDAAHLRVLADGPVALSASDVPPVAAGGAGTAAGAAGAAGAVCAWATEPASKVKTDSTSAH